MCGKLGSWLLVWNKYSNADGKKAFFIFSFAAVPSDISKNKKLIKVSLIYICYGCVYSWQCLCVSEGDFPLSMCLPA